MRDRRAELKTALPAATPATKRGFFMPGSSSFIACVLAALAFSAASAVAEEPVENVEAIISVAEQRLVVLRDGMWIQKFRVSTSKFGLGDSFGSYKTPLGRHRVCEKIGDHLTTGSVIRNRNATGEVLPVNAPGRDPIVTRILWLEGLEERNSNARSRGIYIHGTVEEAKIGTAVSYGCIRMKSREVVELYDLLPIGTIVTIQPEKLPKLVRWTPPPPPALMASAKTTPKVAAKPLDKPPEKTSEPLPIVAERTEKQRETEPIAPPEKKIAHLESKPMEQGKAFDAFKGSILLSDLPGGPQLKTGTSLDSIRGPVLQTTRERPPQPDTETNTGDPAARVSFRTGQSPRAVQ
jgi:hypothetical protein